MSKLSCTSSVVPVVPTSAMTMIVISVLDAVRTENCISIIPTGIIITASVCHWLVWLYPDILERAHYGRVSFLEFLQHFHSMFRLLELARQLVDTLKDHDSK